MTIFNGHTKLFAGVAAVTGILCLIGLWLHRQEAQTGLISLHSIKLTQDSIRVEMAFASWERTLIRANLDSLASEVKTLKARVK